MKRIIFFTLSMFSIITASAQANYFQANIKRNGSNLEFYIKPTTSAANITLRFDAIDFSIRWPMLEAAPIMGLPVVNNVNFPGLTITIEVDDAYGGEPNFITRNLHAGGLPATSSSTSYTAGVEYLVFSVPVSNPISNNVELAGNNEDPSGPYFFSVTKNSPGLGQSDFTSHNSLNGSINNQLYYGTAAQLSRVGQNFYQKIGAGVVPVRFSSFSAIKKDNDAILSWVVENETTNVTYYEVERSVDGINFDKIKTITKNSGTSNIYNIADANLAAIKSNGIIYYRIKQMDVNGEFVYSDIKNVRLTEKGTLISLFPNPVQEFTTVKIDALEATDAIFTLINADGKQLQTSTLKATKGLNLHKLDMSNMPTGDYLLKVTMGTDVQIIKVVKL